MEDVHVIDRGGRSDEDVAAEIVERLIDRCASRE